MVILSEKALRDSKSNHISLDDSIFFAPHSDIVENNRFVYFFTPVNNNLHVFDLETLKILDQIDTQAEIKNIFFTTSGSYITFEQSLLRFWKVPPLKAESLLKINLNS